jgi:uncharacterized membrane protein YciS (DUF1049 family)
MYCKNYIFKVTTLVTTMFCIGLIFNHIYRGTTTLKEHTILASAKQNNFRLLAYFH